MIRPQPARWFEILVARDDAARALEALASTGAAELEARPSAALSATLADLRPLLVRFAEFASRYRDWWPPRRLRPDAFPEPPATTLARCLASLDEWAAAAEPIVEQLQRSATERAELRVWQNLLDAMAGSTLDVSWIAGAGPAMAARLVVSAHDAQPAFPPNVLVRRLASDGLAYTLVVGDEADLRAFALQAVASQLASVYAMPAWMRADPHELPTHAAARLAELDRADADATGRLDTLQRAPRPRARAGRCRAAAMGDRERAGARVRRPVLPDHRLDQRASPATVSSARSSIQARARCCTSRRRRRRACAARSRQSARGRGRSKSSAARSACPARNEADPTTLLVPSSCR